MTRAIAREDYKTGRKQGNKSSPVLLSCFPVSNSNRRQRQGSLTMERIEVTISRHGAEQKGQMVNLVEEEGQMENNQALNSSKEGDSSV